MNIEELTSELRPRQHRGKIPSGLDSIRLCWESLNAELVLQALSSALWNDFLRADGIARAVLIFDNLVGFSGTQPTKVAGTLRRAVRSSAFSGILGGRHMECAYYFDFCRLCLVGAVGIGDPGGSGC